WAATWDKKAKGFTFEQVDDLAARDQKMVLEIMHSPKGDKLFVTTASPGHVNIYDNKDPRHPQFMKAIPTAGGAHHLVLSPDQRYLFVQNSFLNLEGMSDGSVSVIDMAKGEVIKTMDTLKNQGFNPNCIILLP